MCAQGTETQIGKQLNKIINPTQLKPTVKKAPIYCVLPFVGSKSFSLRNKIVRLTEMFYPQLSIRFVWKPDNILKNWFRYKDRIPDALQSSIVYQSCVSWIRFRF